MGINISGMNPLQTHSVAGTFQDKCVPFLGSNAYLQIAFSVMGKKYEILTASIDKENMKKYTAAVEKGDISFDSTYVSMRSVIYAKAAAKALGAESESCAVLAKTLAELGDIEDLPRKDQIEAMKSLTRKWDGETMANHLERSGVKELFAACVQLNEELDGLLSERAELNSDLKEIPALWESARAVQVVLSKIYRHIEDYAALGDEVYRKLHLDIVEEIKPITVQMNR